ncbi:maleylpyruvate isomerase family mycothiol-dependent enzyme [Mycolicibacterium sp. 3033]|nr:maleylpyruvate isomerase family mycothiol-dependent enzyme [Mycolicibacterium aurantiacum]
MDKTGWATEERRSFAELLAGLDDEQWNAPSLCAGWRVRDVAIHIVGYLDRSRAGFFLEMARHRGRVDRLNAADLAHLSTWFREEVVAALQAHADPRGVGAGFGGRIALTECMIHHQDVRQSLELPRTIDAGPLRAALDFARIAPLIRGAVRTRGLRMAGRPDSLSQLSGPGLGALSRRLGAGAR